MTIYKKWDMILVPFPFTDLGSVKRRPALVVSPNGYNRKHPYLVIVFITSHLQQATADDYSIQDWKKSGLPKPSLVKMKFATVEQSMVIKKIGVLQEHDKHHLTRLLTHFFAHD